ncbi:hypothetical protein ABGB19_24965 [Mycobacterium sp. B14F4]|uniref:hypothetical protein n=1 Tax=Mycobacterium sp. B14F4 TaxID=3153565 RepID=UPI00325E76AF
MPKGSQLSRQTFACAASGIILGAVLRYALHTVWPAPPAFPSPAAFPVGGVVMLAVTVGLSLFVAGFAFTAWQPSNLRTFTLGVCAGAASLSQYAVIGISTVAAAGLLVLITAPICGLAGLSAGVYSALLVRAPVSNGSIAE